MKIAVAGIGYVGLSLAVLLAQKNEVVALDIVPEKVDLINNKKTPIIDKEIETYLAEKELDLTATTDAEFAYKNADFVIISTPTNYDPEKSFFDTSSVEAVIEKVLEINPEHAIFEKLKSVYLENRESLKDYADILYFSARLVSGLSVEDSSNVTDKIIELISK